MIIEETRDLIHVKIYTRNLARLYIIDRFKLCYDIADMIEIVIHIFLPVDSKEKPEQASGL